MATFDLGRVTPLYKGDYEAAASYELNDVVLYNGNLYWHVQATATVGILPTDTTVWKLAFADEGVRAEIRGYADDAQDSADSALASKTAAAQSAANASASASQAANSAQTATAKASEATVSAQTASTKASEASASAQSAASSAQTATDKATLASQKAAAASESASLATAKAQAAVTSETNAATAAQTATAKASEAAASATSAQEYDESAQQSAVNAQTSATNAAASETAAKRYAEDSAAYLGAYPTDTAEGEIASFSDGADDIPLKSLVVGIEPVQDTSQGDPSPSNICPISGWTGMNVQKTNGKESTDQDYVAQAYPISWQTEAGTVYGGSLDVTNGVLTVDKAMVDLGAMPWFYQNISNHERFGGTGIRNTVAVPASADVAVDAMCSRYKVITANQTYNHNAGIGISVSNSDGTIYVYDDAYTDSTAFRTAMSGVQFCYPLATPITYQLTPTEVKSLLGQNNIWADTGGTDVTYRADTTMYIQRKIAEAISALS